MRLPSFNRLIPTPQRAIKGMSNQAAGVVVLVATQKYVPNVWVRWGIYVIAATGFNWWYPITRATLAVTGLDAKIENI